MGFKAANGQIALLRWHPTQICPEKSGEGKKEDRWGSNNGIFAVAVDIVFRFFSLGV